MSAVGGSLYGPRKPLWPLIALYFDRATTINVSALRRGYRGNPSVSQPAGAWRSRHSRVGV